MSLAFDNTQRQPRSPAIPAENAAISPKPQNFDRQMSRAHQDLDGDITDVYYAGEILHRLMSDLLGASGPVTLSSSDSCMLLHAMHLMTNRASDLKDKYYDGFKAIPTEGAA